MSPTVEIDRISLRVPGLDRDAAARLGRLIAERLVPSLHPGPDEAGLERLMVDLVARPGESLEALGARIAAQIGDAMEAAR